MQDDARLCKVMQNTAKHWRKVILYTNSKCIRDCLKSLYAKWSDLEPMDV